MRRIQIGLILILLPVILLWTTASTNAAPLIAIAMIEGRTYDQAHDTGYIDWSGPAQYVYVTHRDGSSLPPDEGGIFCGSGCSEWVTQLSDGASASGSFNRDVSSFQVTVGFIPDSGVGSATLRTCSTVDTWNLYGGTGGQPGFVNMPLTVPAGCRSWSLTASGGYVDFRSIDVTYSGPPPTPIFTSTPLPTFTPSATLTPTSTPTFTNTPTPTFTLTSTPTNTPSPTPTPLPPEISGQVVCDLWGDASWCRGNESLELKASDPQGFSVTIGGDLNGTPFSCGGSCSLPLPEGVGTANYSVTSTSGRTASGSSTWLRDVTPPSINLILPPLDGRNGWYVSEVDVSANASDAISGLSSIAGSTDQRATWDSFPIHLSDGVFPVAARARDVAGNEATVTDVIHVDTLAPVSSFTSHSNGQVVHGNVILSGNLEDKTSGIAGGELTSDNRTAWQTVSIGVGDTWSFAWQTGEVSNGQYSLQMRGMDQAGNLGDAVSITLLVDNGPPRVLLTDRWWIWEEGTLAISPNYFPIASLRVTISDLQNRWPAVVMKFNPDKIPGSISWDRHFADGTLAPSGEYRAVAIACDIHDLCGSDAGTIAIPFVATSTVTKTSSPTATMTGTPEITFIATQKPATSTPVLILPSPEIQPNSTEPAKLIPLWQLLGLLGLFLAISSASVIDPRPAALERLRVSIHLISKQNLIDLSKDDEITKGI